MSSASPHAVGPDGTGERPRAGPEPVAGRGGPDPIAESLVQLASRVLDAPYAALTFVEGDRTRTRVATTPAAIGRAPLSASLAPACIADPGTTVVVNAADGALSTSHPAAPAIGPVRVAAAAAVLAPDGAPVGALEVAWSRDRRVSATDQHVLRRLADHASGVLALLADAEEYRRFVELNPDAVAVLDGAARIELANPALTELLGIADPRDLIGRRFTDLLAVSDRSPVGAQLARVLSGRPRTAAFDTALVHADGHTILCAVKAGYLGRAQRHLQVVVHDLSARIAREEEHTRLSEQLARAQRFDTVGQVASGLAHDLNNLLVVMMTNLGLASESLDELEGDVGADAVDTVRQDLAEIQLAVDRAARLTGKLLAFTRREAGIEETAEVAEVVATAVQLVGRSLGPAVSLELTVADHLPEAAVDPAHLERALVNILINARDAVGDEGTIRLFAQPALLPGRPEDGADGRSRPGVRIEVIDDGRGMSPEVRARAFEPLFTTKSGEGGSGLGLASVLAFVDEVDGSVRLASQPGIGTSLSISLPAHGEPELELPVGIDVPVAGARVLLVEPGERTRRSIGAMLRSSGYRVVPAATATEAVAAVEEQAIDLLLVELSLPETSGQRLVERVRETTGPVPVVYLTGADSLPELDGAPVLVKPFSSMRLFRVVERVLTSD